MREGIQRLLASKSKTFLVFCFCILVALGILSLREPNCPGETICSFDSRLITFEGEVVAEPDRRIEDSRYVLAVTQVEKWGARQGQVLITTKNYPEYDYGDVLRVRCFLRRPRPEESATFRYDKYLALQNIFITCSYPQLSEKIGHRYHWFENFLSFKQRIAAQLEILWPEPESSFMAGLLYGSRAGLPDGLKQAFSKTGLSHIVAVSGFNISIIAQITWRLLIFIGLWRRQAFVGVVVLLVFFVIFTGASASVVRAGVMGIAVLIGGQVGRPARMFNSLIFAATIMVIGNHYLLFWDIGFQLSFLSTAGLVYISPHLKNFIPRLAELPFVGETFIATLAAQVATLPLILYYFGQLSVIALPANLLVLWSIPWLMLLGFLALIISFVLFPLGQVIAWLAQLGLNYILILTTWLANQPWSAISLSLSGFSVLLYYLSLVFLLKKYGQRQSESL